MATLAPTPVVRSRARNRPQSLFRQLAAGPRFRDGAIAVRRRPDPRAAAAADESREFELYYRVYNPSLLHDAAGAPPPLVVVHGGPSLPSDYLHPLARQVTSRAIVFYDQLGCGRSSRPEERRLYSIDHSVRDLQALVRGLQLDKFHLLGHSFGGIVAYEYVAAGRGGGGGGGGCLSLTLHSAPSNCRASRDECARLEEEVRRELARDHHAAHPREVTEALVRDALRRRCECRLDELPAPLAAALAGRGTAFGPDDVADYVARPPPRGAAPLPPVLVVRGQHDFVTDRCLGGWRDIFAAQGGGPAAAPARGGAAYREEVLSGCAHYGHLEDARAYRDLVGGHCFVHDY